MKFKERNGKLTLRFDLPGTKPRKQCCVSATTQGEAKKKMWARIAAEAEAAKAKAEAAKTQSVEPSTITVLTYLRGWLEKSVKPPMRRPNTYNIYRQIIERIASAPLAAIPLQQLCGSDIECYLASLTCAAVSVGTAKTVIHAALKRAIKDKLLDANKANPATGVEFRRPSKDQSQEARRHCWSALEARQFLDAAKMTDPQTSAFMCLALDSGGRKSELHGLKWTDLDLEAGTLTIERQLDKAGTTPVFSESTKTGKPRTLALAPETVEQLRRHRQAQAELKMRNRLTYVDYNLIFAKEARDIQMARAVFGQPLKTLAERRYQQLVKASGVRRIKFHGLRHTSASLLLAAGEPPNVVAKRLGHSVAMLLSTYDHVLEGMHRKAAEALGRVLHG